MPDAGSEQAYLAIDIGAESGRLVLGRLQSDILAIDEVHRFANEPVEYEGTLRWDVARLWLEIQRGLNHLGDRRLQGLGVDTWGVDYALLGERGNLLENPYHYRDSRTAGMMETVFARVPPEEIYAVTGIQFMPINTLYQLFAAKLKTPRLLAAADRLITIPDLFHYWLTGTAVCEFTNATTTQLIDPRTRSWATTLLENVGLPSALPAPLVEPGTLIGPLLPGVSRFLSGTPVFAPACHDTASAVAAVHARDDTAFLSSGTWSLVGIEVDAPVITEESRRMNFTNEGGACGTTRLLKNVMGLWMVQECRRSLTRNGSPCDYVELVQATVSQTAFRHLVDPDHQSFLRPSCMLRAIDAFCADTDQPAPQTAGAYVRAILESLAMKYRRVIRDLEYLLGHEIRQIRIVGGGSLNNVLNQFTADATGKRILAGPVEATALGNIALQMLASGATSSLAESRRILERSHPAKVFEPRDTALWDTQWARFQQYCEVKNA